MPLPRPSREERVCIFQRGEYDEREALEFRRAPLFVEVMWRKRDGLDARAVVWLGLRRGGEGGEKGEYELRYCWNGAVVRGDPFLATS